MNSPAKYPVGVQDFAEIIKGGYVYVDKTALMRQLIDTGKYFFLNRPRRFGKSLLLSTFAAWFQGEKELVVIKSEGFIYVLELKVDQSAEAALRQIMGKGYAAPYAVDPRKVFRIGINFSTKSKQIDEWLVREGVKNTV